MPRPRPNCASPASRFDAESVRAIVARTRAEQGLPPTITDPAVIARLATLIGGQRSGAA